MLRVRRFLLRSLKKDLQPNILTLRAVLSLNSPGTSVEINGSSCSKIAISFQLWTIKRFLFQARDCRTWRQHPVNRPGCSRLLCCSFWDFDGHTFCRWKCCSCARSEREVERRCLECSYPLRDYLKERAIKQDRWRSLADTYSARSRTD